MKQSCLKSAIAAIGAFSLFTLSACSSDNSVTGEEPGGNEPVVTPVPTPVIELSTEASRAAAAVQGFNVDFFRNVALSDEYKGKNVACSPVSATMLLSLLSNAASNEAATEIATVLGYSDTKALNNLYTKLSTELPALDSKATLTFANSVWYDKQYTLTDAFSTVANDCYKADVFKRDMTGLTGSVEGEINSWISDKTKGLINSIKVDLPLYYTLINATYFKAAWKNAFKAENTEKATFKGINGNSQVDMMHREGAYYYAHTASYKAIEMPFGAGAFAVTFILPEGDVEEFLKSNALKELISSKLIGENIELSLPRFKIAEDKEVNLTETLYNMGVKSIMSPADINMFNEDVMSQQIKVFQKASVEFNEQGAEAAAVTWGGGNASPGYIPLVFDRPFIFLITEKSTKTILFAGKIMSL